MTQAIEMILDAVRQKQTPAERAAFLDGACGADADLRAAVEERLRAEESSRAADQILPSADASTMLAGGGGDPNMFIGRYRLLQELGEGGFGIVYLAEQRAPVERKVALKIIKIGMDTRQVVARFEQERQALALMDHPGIAKVLDAGATETGRPYFVMELVRGVPITEYCDQHKLGMRERLELFMQVCQAVQHAHQKGIIHRDLKPSNALVTTEGGAPAPKVIDFGIAKALHQRLTQKTLYTEQGQVIGTPAYMSPEQAEGGLDIDTRTDIYSLGVLLYELLTGTLPFDRVTLEQAGYTQIQRLIREVEPPRPSLRVSTLRGRPPAAQREETRLARPAPLDAAVEPPPAAESPKSEPASLDRIAELRRTDPAALRRQLRGDLDWIVMKALEKDRARRYETAAGFAADVLRYLRGEPVLAVPPSTAYRLKKLVLRNKGAFAALAGVAAALVLGAALATYGLIAARTEKANAVMERDRAVAAEREQSRLRTQAEEARAKMAQERDRAVKAETSAADSAAEAHAAAQRAEAINQFLLKVLGEANVRLGGRNATVVEALERASQKVVNAFREQPEVEAATRLQLGQTYCSLGLFAEAEAHLRAALRLHEQLDGGEHKDFPEILQALGLTAAEQGRLAEGESWYRKALALSETANGRDSPQTQRILSNLAVNLTKRGAYAEAEPLLREVYEARKQLQGPKSMETLISLNSLAWCLHQQERFAEAEPLYSAAVETANTALGPDHADTLIFLQNYAQVLNSQGKLAEAEPIARDVAERFRRVYGPDHEKTATALGNLGQLLAARKQPEEAERLLREAVAIRRKVFGDENIAVAESLGKLVTFFRDRQEFAAAEAPAREAYRLIAKLEGPETPRTLLYQSELAWILFSNKKMAEAEPLFRAGVEASRRVCGAQHRDTIIWLNKFAVALHGENRLEEAESFYRQSVEASAAALGPEHPDTLIARYNLAQLVQSRGRLADAEPLTRQVVEQFRRAFGPKHPNTAFVIDGLAKLLRQRGQLPEAEERYREALALRTEILGANHRQTLATAEELAETLLGAGRAEEAGAQARQLLATRRAGLPTGDRDIASSLQLLGLCLTKAGQYEEAEAALRECLKIREQLKPPLETKVAVARGLLGACLAGQRRWAEAEQLLLESYDFLKTYPKAPRADVRAALERLAVFYETWDAAEPAAGKAEMKTNWRERLAAFPADTSSTPTPPEAQDRK